MTLLLHNNLIVNDSYSYKSGPKRRGKIGNKINIDSQYFLKSIQIIDEVLLDLQRLLTDKYINYTRIKVFRELWEYFFSSPILKFDDWWEIDELQDKITGWKENDYYNMASSGEKILINLWNENVDAPPYPWTPEGWQKKGLVVHLLDSETREKVVFLIENIDVLKNRMIKYNLDFAL